MGTWRATAKSLTGESRWSSAPRAASGCTSPAPRSSAPPSQTSGTAPSARRKVQKEEQKLEREQKHGRIHLMESSGRRLQVSRRSHNKEDKLPIIDSGSVLRRVGCLPQYKAPVSRALSIHLSSHHPPTFSPHQCLTSPEALFSSKTIFLAPPRVILYSVSIRLSMFQDWLPVNPVKLNTIGEYHCTNSDLYEFKCDKVAIPGTIRVRNSW